MSKKPPRPGREFEELVARIEKTLQPRGAVVKSPDRLRDLITGHMREVDASITIEENGETKVITVECRDHRRVQDDRWIEQIITKREKLGVWRTIAVSSSDFSESAVKTASHYGVELRRISEVTDREIAEQWAAGFSMALLVMDRTVMGFAVFDEADAVILPDELEPELAAALNAAPFETGFLHRRSDGEIFSAVELGRDAPHPHDIKDDGVPAPYTFELATTGDDWYISTRSGERTVRKIHLQLQFRLRRFPAPIERVKQYSSPDESMLELIEGTVQVDDQSIRMESAVSLNKPLPETKIKRKSSRKKKDD